MREKRNRLDKKTISEMKRQLKDADISIKNNSIFEVILKSDKNGGSFVTLKPTEIEDITFEDLQSIVKRHKSMFEDFTVLIDDVYCPDNEELGIEEVEHVLGLSRIKNSNLAVVTDLKNHYYSIIDLQKRKVIKTYEINIPLKDVIIAEKVRLFN